MNDVGFRVERHDEKRQLLAPNEVATLTVLD
jgi:hypothetical protein